MHEPTEVFNTEYFNWLINFVKGDNKYLFLLFALHKKDFYSTVPNDDNRGADGKALRNLFFKDIGWYLDGALDNPCSVLEMLIGVSIRCNGIMIETGETNNTQKWFWEILNNMGLNKYSNEVYINLNGPVEIDIVLDRVLGRQYDQNGYGGMFPLEHTNKDQRTVEIWYQMSAYLIEKGNIG